MPRARAPFRRLPAVHGLLGPAPGARQTCPGRTGGSSVTAAGPVRPTASNVALLRAPGSCDVTASPASIGPETGRRTLEPATGLHVTPSADVSAVQTPPATP